MIIFLNNLQKLILLKLKTEPTYGMKHAKIPDSKFI